MHIKLAMCGNEAAITAYLRDRDAFSSKKRINQPENFPLYFYKLHKALGENVIFEDLLMAGSGYSERKYNESNNFFD